METASAVQHGNLCLISARYPSIVINPFFPGTLYSGTLRTDLRIRQKVPALPPQPRNCCGDRTGTINWCDLQRKFSAAKQGEQEQTQADPCTSSFDSAAAPQ